jgi:hypothetical protein
MLLHRQVVRSHPFLSNGVTLCFRRFGIVGSGPHRPARDFAARLPAPGT